MINLIIQNNYNTLTLKVSLNFRRLFWLVFNLSVTCCWEEKTTRRNLLKFRPIKSKMNCNFATYNEYLISLRGGFGRLAQAPFYICENKYGQRAGNVFGYRADSKKRKVSEQNFEQRAIFTSTAGRQNKPFYEQNLSHPKGGGGDSALRIWKGWGCSSSCLGV